LRHLIRKLDLSPDAFQMVERYIRGDPPGPGPEVARGIESRSQSAKTFPPSDPPPPPCPGRSEESNRKLAPGTVETVFRKLRAPPARTAPGVPFALLYHLLLIRGTTGFSFCCDGVWSPDGLARMPVPPAARAETPGAAHSQATRPDEACQLLEPALEWALYPRVESSHSVAASR